LHATPPLSVSLDLQKSRKDESAAAEYRSPENANGHNDVAGFLIIDQEISHQYDNQSDESDIVHGKEQLLRFS